MIQSLKGPSAQCRPAVLRRSDARLHKTSRKRRSRFRSEGSWSTVSGRAISASRSRAIGRRAQQSEITRADVEPLVGADSEQAFGRARPTKRHAHIGLVRAAGPCDEPLLWPALVDGQRPGVLPDLAGHALVLWPFGLLQIDRFDDLQHVGGVGPQPGCAGIAGTSEERLERVNTVAGRQFDYRSKSGGRTRCDEKQVVPPPKAEHGVCFAWVGASDDRDRDWASYFRMSSCANFNRSANRPRCGAGRILTAITGGSRFGTVSAALAAAESLGVNS